MWLFWTICFLVFGVIAVIAAMKFSQNKIKSQVQNTKTIENRFIQVGALNVHYMVKGVGPDLVLVHGIGANLVCWRFMIEELSKNYRVWALDLPGFGMSDKPSDYSYGLKNQATTLLRFFDSVGIKQCMLVGNSMGAGISAQLAIMFPERLTGLVLLNSAHDPKIVGIWDIRKIKKLKRFITPLIGRRFIRKALRTLYGTTNPDVPDEIVDAYLRPYLHDKGSAEAFIEAFAALLENQHLVENLQEYSGPIMILWGQHDRLVPIKFGHKLAQDLGVRDFFIHPDAGHHLQEEVPLWVSDKIREFSNKINL
jgi:pimeloyl-ACP methyl ester carboxylesterase